MENRTDRIRELLAKPHTRRALLEKDLLLFWTYYFTDTFVCPLAPFHRSWARAMLSNRHAAFKAYRESLKTTLAKVDIIHAIAYRRKRFITWYGYELRSARAALFDVVVQLQTNARLIADFGQLFPESQRKERKERLSVEEFITTNGVKCKALSLGNGGRGLQYMATDGVYRPDLVVLDDLDTEESVRNPEIIDHHYRWLRGELFGGLSNEAQVIALANVIRSDGIGIRLFGDYQDDPKWHAFEQAVVHGDGTLAWPERYCHTDAEAEGTKKISLQSKQRFLGPTSYNQNFLLIPFASGDCFFDLESVKAMESPTYEEDTKYRQLRIYRPPSGNLLIGVDTARGDGRDYSTIVVRDREMRLYAAYRDKMPPDTLVEVIDRLLELGYHGVVGIEVNNTGHATVAIAKTRPWATQHLYRRRVRDKTTDRATKSYGWETTAASRPVLVNDLEEAVRKGLVFEVDERERAEFPTFVWHHGKPEAIDPNHDDLIMADAICYQMRHEPAQVLLTE